MTVSTLERPLTLGFADPFAHFVGSEFVAPQVAREIREGLDGHAGWTLAQEPFYEHWSAELYDSAHPGAYALPLPAIGDACAMARDAVVEHFDACLSGDSQILAHRMNNGHRIEPHNDAPPLGYECYRVILYLDTPPPGEGDLSLHAGASAPASRIYIPQPGLAIGMAFSRRSFHSVGGLSSGARTTLVFNFWHAGNSPAVEAAVVAHADALSHAPSADGAALNLLLATCRAIDDAKLAQSAYLAAATLASFGGSAEQRDALFLAMIGERHWGSGPVLAGAAATETAREVMRALDEQATVDPALRIARWIGQIAHGIFDPARWSAERELIRGFERNALQAECGRWAALLFG